MTQQQWFNLYVIIMVTIIGQSILAWEFGRKGFVGMAKDGPSKKAIFPFNSWKDFWPLIIVACVFVIARASRQRAE